MNAVSDLQVQTYSGKDVERFKNDLARLRIEIFRDFPYLYDGNFAYEEEYLDTFAKARDNVLVLAFDHDKIVGVSTGLPMDEETEDIKKPWRDAGYDPADIFYLGESVLKHAYRGQGIGLRFFEEREKHARQLNRFKLITFCRVVRPDDHPLKPEHYKPLDAFWKKRGYEPADNIVGYFPWKDIDGEEETFKPLHYWYKTL